MTDDDIIEAVREINADIYDQTQSEGLSMDYRSDGKRSSVMFLGQRIWDDDDDLREYIDGDTQEPLLVFLRRAVREEIKKLAGIWPTPPAESTVDARLKLAAECLTANIDAFELQSKRASSETGEVWANGVVAGLKIADRVLDMAKGGGQ